MLRGKESMEHELTLIFTRTAAIYLSALIAAALFFAMVGIREVRQEKLDGILYVAIAIFFLLAHFYCLLNLPDKTPLGSPQNLAIFWQWMVGVLAPALITLYLVIGLFNFARAHVRTGLVKMFFGLTLVCFLYMLGQSWGVDIKGIVTVVWCMLWFNVELETAA
jgi:hypothetical protein